MFSIVPPVITIKVQGSVTIQTPGLDKLVEFLLSQQSGVTQQEIDAGVESLTHSNKQQEDARTGLQAAIDKENH